MEEDSKWRSEEEEGEEEKGLMAFPLIAPLPTFIRTLHPHIQPPAPAWPSWRGTLVPRTQFPLHGQGMGLYSLRANGLQTHMALPLHGQSTPATTGDVHVQSVPWGCGGTRNTTLPCPSPTHPAPT